MKKKRRNNPRQLPETARTQLWDGHAVCRTSCHGMAAESPWPRATRAHGRAGVTRERLDPGQDGSPPSVELLAGRLQELLPPALPATSIATQALHDWATGLGMAVLTGLIEAGSAFSRAHTMQPSAPAPSTGARVPRGGTAKAPQRSAMPSRRQQPSPARTDPAQVIEGVALGDLLLDKYRIERVVGVGGMGVVVAAEHIHLKKKVAIKLLRPEAGHNPEHLGRFIREAQLVAKLENPHVVGMLDVGTLDSGIPYMVMEYLEGEDLFEWLQHRGVLPVAQAVDFIRQACEAVKEAHRLGIVHRDLKPANLFCTGLAADRITIKVLDFGISKVMDADAEAPETKMTKVQAVFGSPPYMSPEQSWSTRDVDERTDIWSLGVILYELLTGSVPFSGRTDLDLRKTIATQLPLSPRNRRPDIPRALERVVLKCLEKERDRRYQTAAQLAQALLPFGVRPAPDESAARTPRHRSSAGIFVMAATLALFSPCPNKERAAAVARHGQHATSGAGHRTPGTNTAIIR
jgi:eukaryotic-like serine/threonine-protein kinase